MNTIPATNSVEILRRVSVRRACRRMLVLLCGLAAGLTLSAAPLQACPMCKVAVETEDGVQQEPAAYMASILTMLAMPSMLFTVLGVSLYRISRHEQDIADELTNASDPDNDSTRS